MDTLIQDTLKLLQEMAKTTPSVFATAEELAYFNGDPAQQKSHCQKSSLPKQNHPPTDLRLGVEKLFPELPLREAIPDDAVAKKKSCLWKENYLSATVVVIAFGEVGIGLEFLRRITQAISHLLTPAQLIEGSSFEKEQSWEILLNSPLLKTVICSPWSSWKATSLVKYYRQNGSTQEHFLGRHPLILLEPSITYLKHPDRKQLLWKSLNTQLSSLI